MVSHSLDETKAKVEVPYLLFAFGLCKYNLEPNLVLWVCISEARVRVVWNDIVGIFVEPFRILLVKRASLNLHTSSNLRIPLL